MKNPDFRKRRLISSRKSYYKNFKNQQAYKKEYTKRPEVVKRAKEIHLFRREHDLNYKLKLRLRWRLVDAIRKIGARHKYNSSIVLVGCTAEFLKEYLEEGKPVVNEDEIAFLKRGGKLVFDLPRLHVVDERPVAVSRVVSVAAEPHHLPAGDPQTDRLVLADR